MPMKSDKEVCKGFEIKIKKKKLAQLVVSKCNICHGFSLTEVDQENRQQL
jgi:hypothetical protein